MAMKTNKKGNREKVLFFFKYQTTKVTHNHAEREVGSRLIETWLKRELSAKREGALSKKKGQGLRGPAAAPCRGEHSCPLAFRVFFSPLFSVRWSAGGEEYMRAENRGGD